MEPPSSHSVHVVNESGRRAPRSLLAHAVECAFNLNGRANGSVAILLTTDENIRELNRRFRKLDEATDVLSFSSDGIPQAPVGDIAIAVPYAERQARARGVSLSQELAYLAIHGALHLIGFDDETDADRARMVDEMNRVAVATGLKPDLEWSSLLHATNPKSESQDPNSRRAS